MKSEGVPEVVSAAVRAAMPDADATIALRAPEVHQSNQLFDVWAGGRHFIAKQFLKEDEWTTSPAREHASLQRLLPLDIAPKPCFYEATLGPLVIYEYMDGRMWGRYQPTADEMTALATAMASLHSLPTEGLWLARGSEMTPAERVAWFHELLDGYAAWSEVFYPPGQQVVALCRPLVAVAGEVMAQLYATMPPRAFCRSDPRFANVIVRPDGRLGFVDWEDAGLRDPALEMGDLILHTEQEDLLSQATIALFLATYCQLMGLEQARFVERVAQYGRVLPLFYMVILMRYGIGLSKRGKLANWLVNEMPANQRLQRYLARALAGSLWEFDAGAYADVIFFPTS